MGPTCMMSWPVQTRHPLAFSSSSIATALQKQFSIRTAVSLVPPSLWLRAKHPRACRAGHPKPQSLSSAARGPAPVAGAGDVAPALCHGVQLLSEGVEGRADQPRAWGWPSMAMAAGRILLAGPNAVLLVFPEIQQLPTHDNKLCLASWSRCWSTAVQQLLIVCYQIAACLQQGAEHVLQTYCCALVSDASGSGGLKRRGSGAGMLRLLDRLRSNAHLAACCLAAARL